MPIIHDIERMSERKRAETRCMGTRWGGAWRERDLIQYRTAVRNLVFELLYFG